MEDKKVNGVESTPGQKSKSEEGQVKGEVVGERKCEIPPKNSQKYSRDTWTKLKAEFHAGTYLSLKALAKKYGVNPITLNTRMNREKWNEEQRTLQKKVEAVIEQKVIKEVSETTAYLQRLSKRATKYEAIIDASLNQSGSKDENGTNVLDLEAIDVVTRSEARLVEMQRTALRIPALSAMDHTSAGMDLGSSFVQALAKLREDPNAPKLSDSDLQKVLEADIE